MMKRKEIIKNVLIVFCVIIIFEFLGGFVSGVTGLGETAGIFLRTAGLLLLITLGMKLYSQYCTKPLTKEIEEEEIKEADQEDEKQLLFKPSNQIFPILLFLILIGISGIINPPLSKDATNADVFVWFIVSFFIIGLGLLIWYNQPVFIFAEDSVQIKSHLFYLLGIDKKTVIRFADITSVGPNMNGNYGWGKEPKHSLMISMNGTTKGYSLGFYTDDKIARIWLRFKEKLGDKVTIP